MYNVLMHVYRPWEGMIVSVHYVSRDHQLSRTPEKKAYFSPGIIYGIPQAR